MKTIRSMNTVRTIIKDVYGFNTEVAKWFAVVRSAVSNWIKRGNFPAELLLDIAEDAEKAGKPIELRQIPIPKRVGAA